MEPEDRRPEGDPPTSAIEVRALLIFGAVVLVAVLLAGPIGHWVQCQQLAPVERLFTRGC